MARKRQDIGVPIPGESGPAASVHKGENLTMAVPTKASGLKLIVGGQSFWLKGVRMSIGRSDPTSSEHAPEICLEGVGISRLHAELVQTTKGWVLRDLGSSNGTWLGDKRLAAGSGHLLAAGDEIRFGRVKGVLKLA